MENSKKIKSGLNEVISQFQPEFSYQRYESFVPWFFSDLWTKFRINLRYQPKINYFSASLQNSTSEPETRQKLTKQNC